MKRVFILFTAALLGGILHLSAAPTDDVYRLGPDSQPQTGVPQGKITAWAQLPGQAYPGPCMTIASTSRPNTIPRNPPR